MMEGRTMSPKRTAGALALAAAISLFAGAAGQEPPAGEVGLDERLGGTVPLDVTLKDEEGRTVVLGTLIDKPTILTLNYFRCAGICTPLLNGLAEALNALPLEPGKDFQVLTLSFDPRDTPEIAFQKRVNYLKQMSRPFPPAGWRFLVGEGPATRRVADAVGFRFRAQGEDFIHPGVIVVLSPKGMVTRYIYGASFLPADLQMALGEALRGEAQPTISRTPQPFSNRNSVLLFCFSYDPEKRQYVFSVTRLAGAFVLVLAAGFAAYLFLSGKKAGKDPTRSSP